MPAANHPAVVRRDPIASSSTDGRLRPDRAPVPGLGTPRSDTSGAAPLRPSMVQSSATDGERLSDRCLAAACRIAAELFNAPFAGVSVVEGGRRVHLAATRRTIDGVPDETTFCSLVGPDGLVIPDVAEDPRASDHRLAAEGPRTRFYAGVRLSVEGLCGATLCVAAPRPRSNLTGGRLDRLRDIAGFVEAHLRLASALEGRAREAELLGVTLGSMDQGLIVTDADDRITVHNQRAAELIGVPASMLAAGRAFDTVRSFQAARGEFADLPEGLRRWLETGAPDLRVPVYERECPSGHVVEVRTVPMASGGTVRTHTDVTARRAAERALRDGERLYRLIAENASDVIVLCDLDLVRRYVSPAARTVLGREPHDLVGAHPANLVHPDDVGGYLRICDEVRTGARDRALTRQRYRHVDGRWVWLEVSLSLTREPGGSAPDGFVATLRDVNNSWTFHF